MKVCHLSFPHQIPFLPSIEINFSLPQWKKINVIFLILKGTDFFSVIIGVIFYSYHFCYFFTLLDSISKLKSP